MNMLGERSITVDCDVIQADGGTRTASVTGGFVALALACQKLVDDGILDTTPIKNYVSAVSVGIFNGKPVLDLCYAEDSNANVDMNIVMTDKGQFVEVQGTGEDGSFSREELLKLLDLGEKGCKELIELQKEIIG